MTRIAMIIAKPAGLLAKAEYVENQTVTLVVAFSLAVCEAGS
jgi:hypothetical protein